MRLRETREAAADAYVAGSDGLEDATDREEMELLGASGVTIIMISAALGGPTAMKGMEPNHPPDTEKVRSRTRPHPSTAPARPPASRLPPTRLRLWRPDGHAGRARRERNEGRDSPRGSWASQEPQSAIRAAAYPSGPSRVSRAAKATHNAARAHSRRRRERDVNQALPRRPPTPEMVGRPAWNRRDHGESLLNGQRRKENQMTDTTDTDGVRPTPFPNRFQHCSNPRG